MLLSIGRMMVIALLWGWPSLSHANGTAATSILLFGDSIIAGYGVEASDALVVQLQHMLNAERQNFNVINGGVSGDTTSSGRSRLAWALKKHQPDIVLLALGGNDALRGLSPDITRSNLDAMLSMLQQAKVEIIFSQVQAPPNLGAEYKKEFDAIYPELAAKYQVPLIPFLLEETYGHHQLMQNDQIHPNAEGIKVIAASLKRTILALAK